MGRILGLALFALFILLSIGLAKATTLQVGVFSNSEILPNGCYLNLTSADVSIYYYPNQTYVNSHNPSNLVSNCCGSPLTSCYIAIFNIASGSYNVSASATGYVPQSQVINLTSGMGMNFYLSKLNQFKIFLTIKDAITLNPITTVIPCLYYANGTQVPNLPGFLVPNCQITTSYSGYYPIWSGVPTGNYYYTVVASGYAIFTKTTFSLIQDISDNVYMAQSPASVTISSDKTIGNLGDNFTITVHVSSLLPPFVTTRIWVRNPIGSLVLWQDAVPKYANTYNETIFINDYGINDVYAEVTDSGSNTIQSNHLSINIAGGGAGGASMQTIPGIDAVEWTANGWGWVLPFFTPFFLGTMFAVITSGVIARLAKEGMVGGITFVAFMISYTIMGLYPTWIGVILIVISAGVTVQMIGRMLGWIKS